MKLNQFQNYKSLDNVGYFEAVDGVIPSPAITKENHEKIELITGGCVLYDLNGTEIECRAGSIFWHFESEKTINRYIPGQPYSCVVFEFEVHKKIAREIPRYSLWDKPVEVESFSQEMQKCFYDDAYDRKVLGEYIYRQMFWKAYYFTKNEINDQFPLEVKKSLAFLKNSWDQNISVNDIAVHASISVPHLHTLFKKYLKETPHAYLNMRRMQNARILLATTNHPIKKICGMCGFVNLENFCRRFKSYTKMTPSQYRDKHGIVY